MGLKKFLLLAAVVLFVAAGVGFDTLHVGTVVLSVIAFGLACFAAAFLVSQ